MKLYSFDNVIFDLDGVISKTALVHAESWKIAFDEYLRLREGRDKEPFKEFTHQDYLAYVDGKPRYEGVNSFLESRSIHIAWGNPDDSPDEETVCAIGNRKNAKFSQIIGEKSIELYNSTLELVKSLADKGIKVGVASSSKNCRRILKSAGIEELFETCVDGVVSAELGLKGKPEGDIFYTAAANLGKIPAKGVVIEDASSGVRAGRNAGFGLILGLARKDNEKELFNNYADIVMKDLAYIDIDWIETWFRKIPPRLFDVWSRGCKDIPGLDVSGEKGIIINPCYFRSAKDALLGTKKLVFFLDYDGTLTPIVEKPHLAVLSEEMRGILKELSSKCVTAIVSGRGREDVENLVAIDGLFYAGSHGFDIRGKDFSLIQPQAEETIPLILEIVEYLSKAISGIDGVLIENKKFSVAVHYRLVRENNLPLIEDFVRAIVKKHPCLRLMHGKKVFEIMPAIDWNKGKAVRWIMQALKINWSDTTVVYIGDDTTDEDAFRVARARGLSILVSEGSQPSAADFRVSSPDEVKRLFKDIIKHLA